MLIRHEVVVAREESERVDTLRYSWEKLQVLASESQGELIGIQPNFKNDLLESVEAFIVDVDIFAKDYTMVRVVRFCYSAKAIHGPILLFFPSFQKHLKLF